MHNLESIYVCKTYPLHRISVSRPGDIHGFSIYILKAGSRHLAAFTGRENVKDINQMGSVSMMQKLNIRDIDTTYRDL